MDTDMFPFFGKGQPEIVVFMMIITIIFSSLNENDTV